MEQSVIEVSPQSMAVSHRRTADEMKADVSLIFQVMQAVMEPAIDFGLIPGCGDKPTLFKPGAEKLMLAFKLAPDPVTEDLSRDDEIRYRVKITLTHYPTGNVVGYGLGEASSNEEKYKWRKAVSMDEWNATPEDRRRLKYYREGKPTNQVRANAADIANTVLKMAKKRALVDAALTATAASSIFSQDLEDMSKEMAEQVAGAERANSAPAPIKTPQPTTSAQQPTIAAPTTQSRVSPATQKSAAAKGGAPDLRKLVAKFDSECESCGGEVAKGTTVFYDPNRKVVYHEACTGVGE